MEYLIEAMIKIAVEEVIKIAVDHPGIFQTAAAVARRIAMLFWV
jgi:hypothetical protein